MQENNAQAKKAPCI